VSLATIDTLHFWDLVGAAGTVAVFLAAALSLAAGARSLWRRTVGRRRDHYRRLGRLGANGQVSFFNSVLGAPPAMRRSLLAEVTSLPEQAGDTSMSSAYATRIALFYQQVRDLPLDDDEDPTNGLGARENLDEELDDDPVDPESPSAAEDFELVRTPIELMEMVWLDRDYYAQALVDPDDTVLAFSVTARSRRFRPLFQVPSTPGVIERLRFFRHRDGAMRPTPLFRVRLGRTHFAGIGEPSGVFASLGFRRFAYAEAHWFGNPGSYQYYVFSFNDAGAPPWPDSRLIFPEGGGVFRVGVWADAGTTESLDTIKDFRNRTAPNTYTVIGPRFQLEDYPTSFGPDYDEIRTLP
jgi:hypothetical protein